MPSLVFYGQSYTFSSLNDEKIETKTEISLEPALVLNMIHAFIKQTFIQHLLCASHCSGHQG